MLSPNKNSPTRYDSVKAFQDSLPAECKRTKSEGRDYPTVRNSLFKGNPRNLKKAEALLADLEDKALPTDAWLLDQSRTGFAPCVPAFLAVSPDSMFRLENSLQDTAPIRIYISVSASRAFADDDLLKRGCTLLALARKLQSVRPVELYLYTCYAQEGTATGWFGPVVKLDTNPIDMSVASRTVADPAFLRELVFAWCDSHFNAHTLCGQTDVNKCREWLGAQDQDLVIGRANHGDPMMQDPVKWVNDQVKKYAVTLDQIEA